MGVEVGGIIEEMHEDEEGHRVIDKVRVTHFSFVPNGGMEDEVKDATEICRRDLAEEMRCWDELSDEALVEFERLLDDSAPPQEHLTGKCHPCEYRSSDCAPPDM